MMNTAQRNETNPFLQYSVERLSITFTSNGKREFVPRDQVYPLLVAYCSLFPLTH